METRDWVQEIGYWRLGTGDWVQEIGYMVLDTGDLVHVARYRILFILDWVHVTRYSQLGQWTCYRKQGTGFYNRLNLRC